MNNLTVRGITIRDSPMFHIVSQGGSHKRFSNLSLLSGCGFATAPNTDGFNVGGDDIIVSNSHVRNGDDCLPFGGSNLLAERVTCECGNSPGIYMDASTNITYRHHTSLRTAHGANLKAVGGGGGTVSNVLFDNLTIVEPQQAALVIDAFGQWAAADDQPPTAARGLGVAKAGAREVDRHSARNVTFRNVVSPPARRSRAKNAQLTRFPWLSPLARLLGRRWPTACARLATSSAAPPLGAPASPSATSPSHRSPRTSHGSCRCNVVRPNA